jgi:hypothetical protein
VLSLALTSRTMPGGTRFVSSSIKVSNTYLSTLPLYQVAHNLCLWCSSPLSVYSEASTGGSQVYCMVPKQQGRGHIRTSMSTRYRRRERSSEQCLASMGLLTVSHGLVV